MAKPMADIMTSEFQKLLTEKRAVAAKEEQLIAQLRSALNGMGYDIVARRDGAAPRKARGRRPRRPPQTSKGKGTTRRQGRMSPEARKAVSRRMKAYWAKRRKSTPAAKRTMKRRA